MKYVKRLLLLLVVIFAFSGLNLYTGAGDEFKNHEYLEVVLKKDSIPEMPKPVTSINIVTFKIRMAQLESGGVKKPYQAINQYGYIGKYQFGIKTLRGLVRTGDLKATSKEIGEFKNDRDLQERAMDALVVHNKRILLNYGLFKYINTEVKGIRVTMEGMLAASHLLGPYAVSHYLKNGGSLETIDYRGIKIRKYDGNGTSLEKYLEYFS